MQASPRDANLLNDIGYSFLLQSRYGEAEQYLQGALQQNPSQSNAINNLGLLYAKRGDAERALAMFRQLNVPILGVVENMAGDFFGEGALAGQPVRLGTATATSPTTVLTIDKGAMLRLLRNEPTFSERFISYMLARNLRIEADLVDHLFNSSEKRLARALLLLARYGDQAGPERRIPTISQETLAEMVGTTRSRVNFFMNKFRDLGFIEYNGDIKVNTSLLSVVLHD